MPPAMLTTICFLLATFANLPLPAGITGPTLLAQQEKKTASLAPTDIGRLQAAADKGDVRAQSALGKAYRDGDGVPQNDDLAFRWLRKAAEQGDAVAENDLGVLYGLGKGVDRDKEEAVRWYIRAAKQGNAEGMFNLGASYYNGDGVEVDDTASYAWFLLAKEAGNPRAQEAISRAESENKAGPVEAFMKIAQMYAAGDELPKNPSEALKWYRKAGDAGDAEADVRIAGILLAQGRSTTHEEYSEARKRCEAAAERYSPGAYCMAVIYKKGLGVAADPAQTVKWLNRAVDLGDARPTLDLADAFWKGDGVQPDLVTAYMWVWIAFNAQVPGSEAQDKAIRNQMTSKQIERAKKRAHEWYQKHRTFGLHRRTLEVSPSPN